MSATPPPPPSSSSAASSPYGRPSAGAARAGGGGGGSATASPPTTTAAAAAARSFPQQRMPAHPQPAFGRFFHRGGPTTATASAAGSPVFAPSAQSPPPQQRTVPETAGGPRGHVDPAASVAAPAGSSPPPVPPLSATAPELLQSLTLAVHESLAGYLYRDATELAQRLFHLDPSFTNLHLLAHAHLLSGAPGTAYRLLHHHFPFFELHVTRPRTAAGAHGASLDLTAGALPLDARRTLSSAAGAETGVDLGYETVDLRAQWDCQYLLGVCCYRTQHYDDGVRVLSQLLHVRQQLEAAVAALRRQLAAVASGTHRPSAVASTGSPAAAAGADEVAWRASLERQLRAYAFVTEAQHSQLLYWLGLCEKHRQRRSIAMDHLRRSYLLHPTRLDAFEQYVKVGWPAGDTMEALLAMKEPLSEEMEAEEEREHQCGDGPDSTMDDVDGSQRPPQRRAREGAAEMREDEEEEEQQLQGAVRRATETAARGDGAAAASRARALAAARSAPTLAIKPALTLAQRRCVRRHLKPFLLALYCTTTYRCPEAVKAVRELLDAEAAEKAGQQAGKAPSGPAGASTVSPLLLRLLALAQFHNGDVQESAETFERLLRAAPWDLTDPSLIFYSTALWHLKSESALGSLAQRLTDAEPYSPTTFCVVANAYSLIKDPRDALVMLKRAVQVAPTLAYAHALYGYELLGQDNKAEAETAFKTALAADNTLYIAYAGLGERFIREEQVEKARGYYKEAVKLNPTPAIMNRFALTYHRQGNSPTHLKCALRLYTDSLSRHPSNITARRQRTDVLLRLDRPKEALEELKALLVLCPGEAAVYMTLAECMVCLRRPQEALQHYQTAMHLDPRRESYVQGCIERLVAAHML